MAREEMILKAKGAKSAEELLALAKENGIEMTEESAYAYFEQLHKNGELADNELDDVAGGGCHTTDNRLVVTIDHSCEYWVCEHCNGSHKKTDTLFFDEHFCKENDRSGWKVICNTCKYCTYEKGLWLCNNLNNIG